MKVWSLAIVAISLLGASAAQATTISWTNWTSTGSGTVGGNIGGITVTYTGPYSFAQLGTGTNYWTEPNPSSLPYTGNAVIDNAPTPSEMVALNSPGTHTITFSQAVLNPVMAIVSLGTSSRPVSYGFDQAFSVLSEGQGYWGDGTYTTSGNTLTGSELHAALQFTGLVSSISWDSSPNEYWHGITVGVVPLPAALPLLAGGLGFLGFLGWRRRASA